MAHDDNTKASTSHGRDGDQTLAPGEALELVIAGIPVNFHWAPAGTFLMGSPECEQERSDDEFQHEVELTQGFWIAETQTTQELWQAVMGENPSDFKESNQAPVEQVCWFECVEFAEKLNCDYVSALPTGFKCALPTEAQWEYACRAGTSTPFNFGNCLNGDRANCLGTMPYGAISGGKFLKSTTVVKSYEPNAWGLYDMHGNVAEWTLDWYSEDAYTSDSASHAPSGPEDGWAKVLRGGAWGDPAENCRAAFRFYDEPHSLSALYGFRLVLIH